MADSSVYNTDQEVHVDMGVSFHESVIRQVNDEYWAAWWFHRPRVQEWQARLKLYNNQKRDKSRIGSPDVFSFHQVLLSYLWGDKLQVNFKGRTEDDDETCENLGYLYENDYERMKMSQLDYDWDFDATLYGRGLLLLNEWDPKTATPMGEVIDPLTFLRDPQAQSINGNTLGQNGARFFGREIRRTSAEIYESGDYFNLDYLKKDSQGFRTFSPFWDTERARKEAQGYQTPYQSYSLSKNLDWTLLEWFTQIQGERYKLELGNDRTLIIRMEKVKKDWPVIDRTIYPIAHDWDGVSVFDVMEDKQRFRSQLINVMGDLAKAKLYEMWLIDENKIRKNVDLDFELSKRIPVDGDPTNALYPVKHSDAGSEVNFMLDFLDKASQTALGVSEMSLGKGSTQGKGKSTLGQLQLQQGKQDSRMALASNIWGWSESAKVRRWYDLYEENYPAQLSKKVLRIEGASGRDYKEVKRDLIITSHPDGPEIEIESKTQTEAKKLRKYQQLKDYLQIAFSLPETDKMYGIRKLGESVMKKKDVLMLIPYTVDEDIALDENEELEDGKVVPVKIEDNHLVHLRIHKDADPTDHARAHIKMHEFALMMKRMNPNMFPSMNPEGQNPDEAGLAAGDPSAGGGKPIASAAKEGMGSSLEPKPQ